MSDSRPRGRRRSRRWVIGGLVLVAALTVTGVTVDWLPARDGTYSYLKLFNEVLLLVRNSYVEDVEMGDLMHGAYDGLLGSLDPRSEYLTREQHERITRGGDRGDVGIDLSRRGGYLYVVSVVPGSPADEAGLQGGMRLRRIEGRSTRELTLTEAELMLRGEVGTEVTLERFPGDEPVEVVLARQRVVEPRPRLDGAEGAAILRVGALNPGAAAAIRDALRSVEEDSLLVDLRGVSRGDYDEAAAVASLFFGGGDVGTIHFRNGDERVLRARKERGTGSLPARMAVLVDGGTAGPAELLAQALRLRTSAEVLGAKTFGRGTLQEFIPLNDGGYLRLSVARCLDADGQAWDGAGLMPDHLLDSGPDAEGWVAQAMKILDVPDAAERPAA